MSSFLQLKQYQEDFERERQAREQSHHSNQANLMKLKTLKDQKDLLQKEVDRYAQQQAVQAFGNHRYSHPPSPVTPTSPVYSNTSSSYLPYGGQNRGYDIDEQHRQEMLGQVPNRTYQRVPEPVQVGYVILIQASETNAEISVIPIMMTVEFVVVEKDVPSLPVLTEHFFHIIVKLWQSG